MANNTESWSPNHDFTMPKYSAKVAVRKARTNKQGLAPAYLEMRLNGKRERVEMGLKVPVSNWNNEKQKLYPGKGYSAASIDDMNMIMNNELNRVLAIFRDYRIKEKQLDGSLLKKELQKKGSTNSFHDWVDVKINELIGVRAKRTIDHYRVTFRRLREFKPTLSFYDLTTELPTEFDNWLIKNCGLQAVNTRAKYHKHLKTFTRMLERSGEANIPNVYKYFKVKQVKSKRTFLTKDEVMRLVKLYEEKRLSPHILKALQRFLFSCHCGGIRCADLNRITWNHIEDGFLCFFPEKTQHIDKLIEVPVTNYALQFVQNKSGHLFDELSNQKYNEYLKVIQRCAGISKTLTTHVARHTFATNYLVAGGRREVLQKILGHTDPQTTEVYVHTTRLHLQAEKHILNQMY